MNFQDKVVWITGASSGIGEGLVYAFAKEKAKLAISSRNQVELERVKDNCPSGAVIEIFPLDIADFDQVPRVAEQIIERFGMLDILINNAGISQRELAQDTQLDVDRKLMEVNFLGTVAVTKAVLPTFIRQRFGHIVVMSSVLGKYGAPHRSTYSASKHALHGFFDSLRPELKDYQVDITLLCPGYVRTNVTINALRGDGSPNSVMAESTAAGVDPVKFAEQALKLIQQRKPEAYLGGKEAFAIYIKRFLPGLHRRIMNRIKLR
jgi:short-subunit dehydrogenase